MKLENHVKNAFEHKSAYSFGEFKMFGGPHCFRAEILLKR